MEHSYLLSHSIHSAKLLSFGLCTGKELSSFSIQHPIHSVWDTLVPFPVSHIPFCDLFRVSKPIVEFHGIESLERTIKNNTGITRAQEHSPAGLSQRQPGTIAHDILDHLYLTNTT